MLEYRQLLSAAPAPVETELQIYNGMGVQTVLIALPPDAVSFESQTFSPVLGTAVFDTSGSMSVIYEYTSSGVDSFGVSYLDGDGIVQTQNVSILIFDDYTGSVLLDGPDPQTEDDFFGGLYNEFLNGTQGTGGSGAGSGSGSGGGTGSEPGGGGSNNGLPPGPEIIIYGNNLEIVDGDTTPRIEDHTDYEVVLPGQYRDRTFRVKNTGTAVLSLSMNQLPPAWIVIDNLAPALSPGVEDSLTIRFQPYSSGQYTATVSILNNDANESPYDFVIRGVTSAPEIGVSGGGTVIVDGDTTPTSGDGTDFGSTTSGNFVDRVFTVHNSGSALLTLSYLTVPSGFTVVQGLVGELAPGISDTFTVRFAPPAPGNYGGEIGIGNNDSDENPFNFSIRGTIGAPEIEVRGGGVVIVDGDSTPSSIENTDFGILSTGQTVSRTFTVKNTGTATLTLSPPVLPIGYSITESLAGELAPNVSDTFTVRFAPTDPGTYSGEISIDNNDADENPYNFLITGLLNAPEISVYGNGYLIVDGDVVPSPTDGTWFGTVGPNETADRTFVVNNTGTVPLTVTLGGMPVGFVVIESLTGPIAPGGYDEFTVRFAPPAEVRSYGGEISITNNDPNEAPYNFVILGARGTPEISVLGKGITIVDGDNTPTAADDTYFGMTPPNIVATRTFTVVNSGTSVLKLGQPSVSGGAGFRLGGNTLLPELQPGQSDTFSIELLSSTPGTYNSTVTIWNNDTSGLDGLNESPYNFAIRGIVGAPEIDVTGNGNLIVDGDVNPNTYDNTDFGTVVAGTLATRTFTVSNTGTGTLYLGRPSVTGTGFWRGAKALATFLEPGQSDTFDVKFSSTTAGAFTGEVILYNSDANEAPYNFRIKAEAKAPEIAVSGNGNDIMNGDSTPETMDGTEFGKVVKGDKGISHTFYVNNTGNATLTLGNPTLPDGFVIGDDTLSPEIPPGGSDGFTITLSPEATLGVKLGIVTIPNDDSDEKPFTFTIRGGIEEPIEDCHCLTERVITQLGGQDIIPTHFDDLHALLQSAIDNGQIIYTEISGKYEVQVNGEWQEVNGPQWLIKRLGDKDIRPTPFNQLSLKLQQAIYNSYVIQSPSSGLYQILLPDSSVDESLGPKWLSDPSIQWVMKLEAAKEKYHCYQFYEILGVGHFYDTLIQATENLGFAGSAGSAEAIFDFGIIRTSKPIEEVATETVVHESVHAEDWRNGWYIGGNIATTIPTLEEAEALAYTAQALTALFSSLAKIEDRICGTHASAAAIKDDWSAFVGGLTGVFQTDVVWSYGTRKVTSADVNDVDARLGLSVAAATLRQKYVSMAAEGGLSPDLSTPAIPFPFNN